MFQWGILWGMDNDILCKCEVDIVHFYLNIRLIYYYKNETSINVYSLIRNENFSFRVPLVAKQQVF